MTTWDDRSLVEDLLARGVDDWISASEVYSVGMRTFLAEPVELRALAVGLIAEMLIGGLVVAGDITAGRHTPWECSAAEAIGRIAEDWFARPNPSVLPGDVVWLDITPKGETIGKAVLEREAGRQAPGG